MSSNDSANDVATVAELRAPGPPSLLRRAFNPREPSSADGLALDGEEALTAFDPSTLSELHACGFRCLLAVENKYSSAADFLSDDGLIFAIVRYRRGGRDVWLRTLFSDGGGIESARPWYEDLSHGSPLTSLPLDASITRSVEYHRRAIQHHTARNRRPVRIDTMSDLFKAAHHYELYLKPRVARAKGIRVLLALGALLFGILKYGADLMFWLVELV